MNYIVAGPPGSGKTTYVMNRRSPGDLIVDTDAIYQAITGLPLYDKPDNLLDVVMSVKQTLLAHIRPTNSWFNSWVIITGAHQQERSRLAAQLSAQVIVLEIGYSDCVRRIQQDKSRPEFVRKYYPAIIEKWWNTYQRYPSDTIITLKDQVAKAPKP